MISAAIRSRARSAARLTLAMSRTDDGGVSPAVPSPTIWSAFARIARAVVSVKPTNTRSGDESSFGCV